METKKTRLQDLFFDLLMHEFEICSLNKLFNILPSRPKFWSVPSLMIEIIQSFFAEAKSLSHINTVSSDF